MLYNINDLKVGSDQDIILLIKCVEQGESQNGAYFYIHFSCFLRSNFYL